MPHTLPQTVAKPDARAVLVATLRHAGVRRSVFCAASRMLYALRACAREHPDLFRGCFVLDKSFPATWRARQRRGPGWLLAGLKPLPKPSCSALAQRASPSWRPLRGACFNGSNS